MSGPVLLVGAAGRLGAAIADAFSHRSVVALTRGSLDITDPESVRTTVGRIAPAAIINCAAFNDVDGAEDRPADALAVNGFALRSLARAAEAHGAVLVHYSTDFVFDGNATTPYAETVAPAPRSTYGLSKLLGEWFALDAPRSYVLRVESLFGAVPDWTGRHGSLDVIVDGLEEGREVKVFTDRVVSPTHVLDIAAATRHLIETDAAAGLYHCVNSGHATWHDIAVEAARLLGVQARLVPVACAGLAFKADRPLYCALDNDKLARAGFSMPPWQEALARWLNGRRQVNVGQ